MNSDSSGGGYTKARSMQHRDALLLLGQHLAWRDGDAVLDVGCGTGEIARHIADRKEVATVVGLDISKDMVNFATSKNTAEKASYHVLDIQDESGIREDWRGKFTKAVSFHTVHWIPNKERFLANVHMCLEKGGELLFNLFAGVPAIKVARDIKHHPKWREYLTDYALQLYEWPKGDVAGMSHLLEECGFEVVTCEVHTLTFKLDSLEKEKAFSRPLLGHLQYIPEEKQDDFLEDAISMARELYQKDEEGRVAWEMPQIVVHARKL
ncbi:juvenile hormone acid O-methyltransferase-like [Branchiostoma floridae x Branchiostoma japonicum]